jgi:hypothetical protein
VLEKIVVRGLLAKRITEEAKTLKQLKQRLK